MTLRLHAGWVSASVRTGAHGDITYRAVLGVDTCLYLAHHLATLLPPLSSITTASGVSTAKMAGTFGMS